MYIHIPFCASFCDYCDFYSVRMPSDCKTADRLINKYIDALLVEMERMIAEFGVTSVPSVYIGGGTPSMLGVAGISRLLQGIAVLLPPMPRHLPQQIPREFTVEANPESADEAFFAACRDNGVNRISLGVQSFCDASRRLVHRAGDAAPGVSMAALIPDRLKLVSEIFGGNFSADLIAGLPAQDETVLLRDIEKLLSYRPAHVSLYALTAEEGTPLGDDPRFKQILPSADEADRLWIAGRDALEQAGYGQYEVSNFALSGKQSAHNIRYWRMENWLGLGAAASGTIIDNDAGTGQRFTYAADTGPWLDRKAGTVVPLGIEELDRLTLMKETFLMGFRYIEGPDQALFEKRFGITLERAIPRTLAKWRGRGLLQAEPSAEPCFPSESLRRGSPPGKIALTKEGLLMLDPFLIDIFEEIG
ncbi:coproporphyrinogen III oxidase [Spirochaetia bacterium]|nr:coproporphyrinogen III oxidase [Spirochaetia bacterium]